MKYFLFTCILLFYKHTSFADPGVGIVMDSKGNLFYTDLVNVWMIQPDGRKSIAVAGVHTHELYMSPEDELLGEHLWYDAAAKNPWHHYLWKRKADGSIVKLKDTTDGFADWTSFVRDRKGNEYIVEKNIPSLFWKIDNTGKKQLLGAASLSGIGRLHLSPKGVLFFSNKADLYCIPPGDSLQLYLKNIGSEGILDKIGNGGHTILSTWSDAKNNLYIATGGVIKKINRHKKATVIYTSTGGWKPSGGLITPKNELWVLEYNSKNEVRVTKIMAPPTASAAGENTFKVATIPLLLTAGIATVVYFLIRKKASFV